MNEICFMKEAQQTETERRIERERGGESEQKKKENHCHCVLFVVATAFNTVPSCPQYQTRLNEDKPYIKPIGMLFVCLNGRMILFICCWFARWFVVNAY